jgi:hypothetical protein
MPVVAALALHVESSVDHQRGHAHRRKPVKGVMHHAHVNSSDINIFRLDGTSGHGLLLIQERAALFSPLVKGEQQ